MEWKKKLLRAYMNTNFYPLSDYSFVISGRSYLGKVEGVSPKIAIFDFDGVFEKPGTKKLYQLFFEELAKENKRIKKMWKEIEEIDESIKRPEDVPEADERFSGVYRECRLRKEEYEKACIRAAYRLELTKGVRECLRELEKMMYSIFIISGSPTLALKEVGRRIGIDEKRIFGTDYIFSKEGKFLGLYLRLGDRKKELRDFLFEDVIGIKSGCYLILDDDITLDAPLLKVGMNPVILLGRVEKVGDVMVTCPEAREDMRRVPPLVKRFEYGWVCVNLRNLEKEMRIIEIGRKVREAYGMKNIQEFLKYSSLLIEECGKLVRRKYLRKVLLKLLLAKVSMEEVYEEMRSEIPELDESFVF